MSILCNFNLFSYFIFFGITVVPAFQEGIDVLSSNFRGAFTQNEFALDLSFDQNNWHSFGFNFNVVSERTQMLAVRLNYQISIYLNVSENQWFSWGGVCLSALGKGIEQDAWSFFIEKTKSWLWVAEHLSNSSIIEWNDNWSFIVSNPGFSVLINSVNSCNGIKWSEDLNSSFRFSNRNNIISFDKIYFYCWNRQRWLICWLTFLVRLKHHRGRQSILYHQFEFYYRFLNRLRLKVLLFF